MWIYVKLIFAKIFYLRTKSWIVEFGEEGSIVPPQRTIMYKPYRSIKERFLS